MENQKVKASLFKATFMMINFIFYLKVFGNENIMLGTVLGIAAIMFLRRDFREELLYRATTFLIINLYLVVASYLVNLNIYIGIILNFTTIFTITYLYMNDFKNPTSYMFLMMYIFMISTEITQQELPTRLLAVGAGVIIIIIAQVMINRTTAKEKSDIAINTIIDKLKKQIDNLILEKYDEKESIKINQQIRYLIASTSIKRYKHFKHNKVAIKQFSIGICLSRLNTMISHVASFKVDKEKKNEYLNDLKIQVENINNLNKNLQTIEQVNFRVDEFINKYKNLNLKLIDESIYVFKIFKEIIDYSEENKENVVTKLYENINTKKPFNLFKLMRENFNINSLKFRYSIRLAIGISIMVFLAQITNINHESWIILSCYVVLQPYKEDGLIKAQKRFIGVIIGVTIFFIVFSIIKDRISIQVVLFIGFIGYFYFADYSKKVVMTTILSLTVASISENIHTISINRFILVTTGIVIGLLFNKYFLPYNIEDSIKELKYKYKKNTRQMLNELDEIKHGRLNMLNIINLSIDRNKIEQNLILNSNKLNKGNINTFIHDQSIKMGSEKYLILNYLYLNYYQKRSNFN
ncbi:FUSC family protein [Romboutsia lituseburensis]|uniref:FUSC family protein n=1 Tax=Romboutsia lituseburensis TaxID=1537 RepID=UPI00215B764B|nr:FUSC family protein [Romboutsia lituseburensis]MCR8746778.1 FUSC family protein [Romboutsia lituseburensis]